MVAAANHADSPVILNDGSTVATLADDGTYVIEFKTGRAGDSLAISIPRTKVVDQYCQARMPYS